VKNKIKILITTSSYEQSNTGVGGHYRSALVLRDLLANPFDAKVISYGDLFPPVYSEKPNVHHVNCSSNASFGAVLDHIEKHEIAGDDLKLLIIAIGGVEQFYDMGKVAKAIDCGFAICKPGGATYKHDWIFRPYPAVVFSGEDLTRFEARNPKRPLFIFESRAQCPAFDMKLLSEFAEISGFKVEKGAREKKQILIVCRITKKKSQFINGALNLLAEFSSDFISVVFVGICQEAEYLDELRRENPRVKFITQSYYVNDASRLFWIADAAICIGRTAQEALSIGCPTFIPVQIGDWSKLIFVDKAVIERLKFYNFTSRVAASIDPSHERLTVMTPDLFMEDEWHKIIASTELVHREYLDIGSQLLALRAFVVKSIAFKKPGFFWSLLLIIFRAAALKKKPSSR